MNRLEQIIPTGIVAATGIWVCWISFTQQPSQAFLFPRIFSGVFVALALWTFAEALLGRSKTGGGLTLRMVSNFAPGLVVSVIYIFWAAKSLGFYTASTLAFFILVSLYDPAPHGQVGSWIKRAVITVGFIAVIYALFAVVLKVYTPRGMFM
ncbi:MAG: tripartite tricarboxylate transporter TctB family protein [Rhodobacteraceae bacterium]|nr:tripartite tricarboxylate transporter TctB family protein [Paracoccaceae bacterium]